MTRQEANPASRSAFTTPEVSLASKPRGVEEQSEPVPVVKARLLPPPEGRNIDIVNTSRDLIGLNEVIAACIANDPKLKAGWEDLSQATGDYLTASLPRNPTLKVSSTLLPLTRAFTVERTGGPPQLDVWLSYPLDWYLFGKQAAAKATASAGVRVSQAEYEDLIRQRIQEAGLAYYDFLEAKALVELARDDLDSLKHIELLYKKGAEAALKGKRELNPLPLEKATNQRTLREAEGNFVAAQARLRALMGGPGFGPGIDVVGSLMVSTETRPVPLEEAVALAERNRADMQAARDRIVRSQFTVLEEQRKACPDLVARAGYQRQFQEKAIGAPDANAWGFEFEMTLPCFDRNQGNRHKAESTLRQSHHRLNAALLDLRVEIERAVAEHQAALNSVHSLALDQVKLANEVRDAYAKALETGDRSLAEVIEAQRNFRDLNRLYLSNHANCLRAIVKLNAAVGTQLVP